MPSSNGHRLPEELTDEQTTCKNGTFRHAWWPCNPPQPREGTIAARPNMELVSAYCERCGWLKHEVWNKRTGERMTRPRYEHPESYTTVPKGITGDDWRAELLMRWDARPPQLFEIDYEE